MAMAGLGMAPASPTSSASSAGPAESGRTSVDISVPPPSTLFNPSFNGRRRVTDAGTKLGHSTLGTKGTFCSKCNLSSGKTHTKSIFVYLTTKRGGGYYRLVKQDMKIFPGYFFQ